MSDTPEARVREALDDIGLGDGDRNRILNAMQPHATDANMDVPFQPMDEHDSVARHGADLMRQALGMGEGVIVADTVVVKALGIDTAAGRIGAVLHDFSLGNPYGPPLPVASVLYLGGSAELLRKYGVLVRDCANGAANTVAR